ncbi:GntR family transcriptional regulator [Haloactinopolyspora alba]|uniref:GntR family transcriptional regulator n=1 Tax=Haloactinopolyspora alba TaxID=648780 RepID=A0A2P8DTA5_9ACTN|nr:FadR/GntR family transcriptional regulator [Haloactinopolyspora alba]PSL00441.1 GntR family transcriptional regulator [Haloactinopolyspora alba]
MSESGLERRSLLDDLTAGLVELIENGSYQIGDRLPSVSALATQFGVATPTLREAARRLEATGTIQFRHGSGIYVSGDSRRLVIANPARSEIGDVATLDVLDTRLLIEPELAGRAARRGEDTQIAEIESVLGAAARAITDGWEPTITQLNMRFHVAIARAAGNKVLAETLQSTVELYEPQQRVIGDLYADPKHDHDEHSDIYDAIVQHDPARAADLMRTHLEGVIAVVSRKLRESPDPNQ